MKELCALEQIPPQFAYKILKKLEKGGIVTVLRGVKGGCRLNSDPHAYNLYQVLKALGERQVAEAEDKEEQRHLIRIEKRLDEMLKSQNLAELLE